MAALCLLTAACAQKEISEYRQISLSFSETEVKTALNPGRTALQWQEGDVISVYNDHDGNIAPATYRSAESIKVSVPVDATLIKVTYPETSGSYADPGFVFQEVQVQPAAGVLGGDNYPIVAEAAIVQDAAVLHFSAVGSAFALNVYNPKESGEKLQGISVQPSQRESAIRVSLAEPFAVGADKPSDKRTYEGQVYACLEKGQYNRIVFTVETDRYRYSITSNDTMMDLESHDFFVVNLDLAHLKAYVYVGVQSEDFTMEEEDVTLSGAGFVELERHFQTALTLEDRIPDFSTVGYAHGDASSFPDYGNIVEVPAPGGGDDTQIIQNCIDNAPEGSVVLLKSGTYQVGGVLILDRNRVILRGAGRDDTVLRLTGTLLRPGIVIGATVPGEGFSGRKFHMDTLRVKKASNPNANVRLDRWLPESPSLSSGVAVSVAESYCPVGRDTLVVSDASVFAPGCDVLVGRPHNADWIADLLMTDIWTRDMSMTWTRKVTGIEGNRLILDAPLVQSLDALYGGGSVTLYSLERVSGCGVENLSLESSYDASIVEDGVCVDEKHAWFGMFFSAAEDCWASDVAVKYFGYAAVQVSSGARCITVDNCSYEQPVSYPDVARRYGFVIEGADLCLFRNCRAERSAIGFSVNTKGHGPNVFLSCTGTDMRTGSGPHQLWGTGTLYDNCANDAGFRCTDHGSSGSGHGWMGANTVFWNVEAGSGEIECESPYVSGRNYCIGLLGGIRVRYGGSGWERPDASWYPEPVPYGSGGTRHVDLNEEASAIEWLRPFSKSSFVHPESLYQCQLEDRKYRSK